MNKQNWMGSLPELGRLRIDQLILPGSHDSGMDKQADNIVPPQEVTQDVACIEQIRGGIRVLDLRVRANREYTPDSPNRYKLYHLSTSGRTVLGDIVAELQRFYAEPGNEREIIILDFHQFDNFSAQEHEWLLAMLDKHLGQRIIPYDLHPLTLEQLWNDYPGKTVVIAYNDKAAPGHWDGVEQVWMGENTPSTAELKAFMDHNSKRYKPDGTLRSIQCAKYNKVLFTPDDFSDKIDEWFESVDLDSYIQGFHIINTDWSLRSRIVDNCIHACLLRAQNTP
ncbi:PI-PLC domain-containing protein [Pseudomonas promysalinigenes]